MTHATAPPRADRPDDAARARSRLEQAVLEAVTYADVFDFALTPAEVHRDLPTPATPEEVSAALATSPLLRRVLRRVDGLLTLPGREELAALRRRRSVAASRLWPAAIRYGRLVGSLPLVRMVAVTGSLAAGTADDDADVDLLVVTVDGRTWLARALSIGIVRGAALRGLTLCPNYFLAERALDLDDRSRFTAHELAQMVPLTGLGTYAELLRRNAWYRDYLPNRESPWLARPFDDRAPGRLRRSAEAALRSRPFELLERWERERKVRRLSAGGSDGEACFDADRCKGHLDGHRARSLAAFEERLALVARLVEAAEAPA